MPNPFGRSALGDASVSVRREMRSPLPRCHGRMVPDLTEVTKTSRPNRMSPPPQPHLGRGRTAVSSGARAPSRFRPFDHRLRRCRAWCPIPPRSAGESYPQQFKDRPSESGRTCVQMFGAGSTHCPNPQRVDQLRRHSATEENSVSGGLYSTSADFPSISTNRTINSEP